MAGTPWTVDDEETLRLLRRRGEKAATIAALLNRTVIAVETRCKERRIAAKRTRGYHKVMSAAGPAIAETERWITEAEDDAFEILMAGRRHEDRRLKSGGLA